jgi:hypothetical protein
MQLSEIELPQFTYYTGMRRSKPDIKYRNHSQNTRLYDEIESVMTMTPTKFLPDFSEGQSKSKINLKEDSSLDQASYNYYKESKNANKNKKPAVSKYKSSSALYYPRKGE